MPPIAVGGKQRNVWNIARAVGGYAIGRLPGRLGVALTIRRRFKVECFQRATVIRGAIARAAAARAGILVEGVGGGFVASAAGAIAEETA